MPNDPHHYDFTPVDPSERSIFDRPGDRPLNRGGGGGDPITILLGSKLWIPLFLFTLWILYPVSGCVAFAVLWAGAKVMGMFFSDWIAFFIAVPPALVVLWFMCRWDCAMGENKTYWLVRHIFRLCAIMGLLFYAVTSDRYPHPTFGQVVSNVIHTPEMLYMGLLVLGFLHWILVGKYGTIKSFWHGGLELILLRPKSLEQTEIIMPKRPETFAEAQQRIRNRRVP